MNRTRALTLLIFITLIVSACVPTPTPSPVSPPPTGGTLTVAFLDIGQGDSILIRSPKGSTMLIDGGNSAGDGMDVIIPKLREWGASQLDVMVATHPDADHIGGLPAVVANFPVANVALTGQIHTTKVYETLLTAVRDKNVNAIETRTGTPIPFDPAVKVEVLGPDDKAVQNEADTNNASIVIKLTYGQISFMFTGDAEAVEEQAILSSGANVHSTVLKAGHHGSRSSTSAPWLAAVAPQIAVISAGKDNRYGHPHPEVLDRLNQAGVRVYRTDESGTITITTDGSTLNVTTDK